MLGLHFDPFKRPLNDGLRPIREIGDPIKNPLSGPPLLDQTSLAQNRQVLGHTGLRDLQCVGQLADANLAVGGN